MPQLCRRSGNLVLSNDNLKSSHKLPFPNMEAFKLLLRDGAALLEQLCLCLENRATLCFHVSR